MERAMDSQNQNGSMISMLVGFVTALSNHFFGWFNSLFKVTMLSSNLNEFVQAFIMGMIGASGAFVANKIWKFIDKKIFKRDKHKHNGS